MADVHSAFEFNSVPCKRKRRPEDVDDEFLNPHAKRRSSHCLPIRLSPSRSQVSIPPAFPMFTSIYQQPPTPVDTSDEESSSHSRDEHRSTSKPSSTHDHRLNSDSSMSFTNAEYGDSLDVDMDLNLGSASQPRIRRARSNDIIAPHRDSIFLNAVDNSSRERVPTPINSHFDNRVNDLPNVPRHHFPPLRTNLSPMFEQETWISRDGLPSPTEDQDMDTVMMLDHTNSTSGLHVVDNGVDGIQLMERYEDQSNGRSSHERLRTAKLHMGFLNGCEKCMQKVPGHYSHILRP
ncbi:hypothetical protein A1O1_03632 [Capronia coronata CBS 617.96]|uniref:Uncharacterized protein n=1 Tax=Capronia coronata CBS 617.96 TaxID=1182541 RepID=W9Z7P2_9EURO|nr:uncharacterized protein A1O1_03632 [Capronia coronata CBS 617.96]EXJ90529.1 hypothetical protein A1O1_03632 [Capronia coronata CBS 617.96]